MIEHQFCIHPRSKQLLEWMLIAPLPGPLLITGISSIGKQTLAVLIARRLLCDNHAIALCDCPSCTALHHDTHSDLLRIGDEETPLTVDAVRRIRSQISQTPMNSNGRVIIVLDCQRLTNEASNALLKCIEEPIGNTQWILTASHTKQIPATLLSRLYRLRLPRVPDTTIVEWVTSVLQSTHPPIELVTQCAGRPGVVRQALINPQQHREYQNNQEAIQLGLWGEGSPPSTDGAEDALEPLLTEVSEQLRQSAFQGSISWDRWLRRAQILDDVMIGLQRHQSIVQLLHYAHSQQ